MYGLVPERVETALLLPQQSGRLGMIAACRTQVERAKRENYYFEVLRGFCFRAQTKDSVERGAIHLRRPEDILQRLSLAKDDVNI
eukprot:4429566-Alexandrium_andersonii.AAC.1